MRYIFAGYLVFIIIVAIIVAFLALRLHIKSPIRFFLITLLFIVSPIIISYSAFNFFYALPEVAVPNVLGMPEEAAVQKIEESGLKVNIEKRYEGEDMVTFERPEADRIVKEGRTITLIVGRPKTIEGIIISTGESTQ